MKVILSGGMEPKDAFWEESERGRKLVELFLILHESFVILQERKKERKKRKRKI